MANTIEITANAIAELNKDVTVEQVNAVLKKAASGSLKGILDYSEEELVSSDIIGSTASSIFDPNYTDVVDGTFVKIYGWYDNEWGYSCRIVDLVGKMVI